LGTCGVLIGSFINGALAADKGARAFIVVVLSGLFAQEIVSLRAARREIRRHRRGTERTGD
jgi:hypothetical protein